MRSFKLPPRPILSFASLALIPPPTLLFTAPDSSSLLGEAPPAKAGVSAGGLGGLGFHETPPAGLGRNGGGARAGSLPALGFSKAAMRSRSEPGLGFGGGGASDMVTVVWGHAFDVPTLSFGASVCACFDSVQF
jgi:hypothetical protein